MNENEKTEFTVSEDTLGDVSGGTGSDRPKFNVQQRVKFLDEYCFEYLTGKIIMREKENAWLYTVYLDAGQKRGDKEITARYMRLALEDLKYYTEVI